MSKFAIDPAFDPHVFALSDGAGPQSADRKAPPASALYPNLNDFARVDVERYMSRAHMELEWQRLWRRIWTCAGRESDIPLPGNYFRYDLGRESFIVTRGHDGLIRAFYNSCQHRGRQLIDDDFGTRVRFVCPFHGWSYDLTGANKMVTDKPLFSERALCGDLNLKQARCETWAGSIFVNMDPNAPPLIGFLGEVPALMAAYRMESMFVVKDTVLRVDCNWKIGLEAFIEAYHVQATHPQALPMLDDIYEQCDIYANGHARLATPLGVPSPRIFSENKQALSNELAFLLQEAGLDPALYKGRPTNVREAIWRAKRSADNRFGLDYSAFTNSQILDDWNYFIYPNMTLNCHPEGVSMMRFLPHPSDPEKFFYHVHVIMPKLREGARPPFYMGVGADDDVSGNTRPEREHTSMEQPNMGEVFEQDITNMRGTQLGLHSQGFPGGMRFAERELRVQVFHAETDLRLRGLK
jgi:phenylpropionate dioxygenase-like ring-hydroxylating dioxygenase large terminal subunit